MGKEFKYWVNDETYKAIKKFQERRENYSFIFYKPEHDIIRENRERNKRNLKWVEVFVGHTQKRAMIDKKTNIIYKVDIGYKPTFEIQSKAWNMRYLSSMEL